MGDQKDEQKIYFEDKNRKTSRIQRLIAFIASVSLWAVFLYLLQFFLTSLFLAFAAFYLYGQLFASDAVSGTWALVQFSVIVSIIAFAVLFIWAAWNKILYGGLDRRRPRSMPADGTIEKLYEQAPGTLQMVRRQQRLWVCYTENRKFDVLPYAKRPLVEEHHEKRQA